MNDESRNVGSELIDVLVSEEELAAIEGWRQANGFATVESAARHLIRLGLLSEIGRIYRSVRSDGEPR